MAAVAGRVEVEEHVPVQKPLGAIFHVSDGAIHMVAPLRNRRAIFCWPPSCLECDPVQADHSGASVPKGIRLRSAICSESLIMFGRASSLSLWTAADTDMQILRPLPISVAKVHL